MRRREFIRSALSGAGALMASGLLPSGGRAPQRRPPNFIFVLADDLGCYGNPIAMNPDCSRVELYDILRDPMEVDNLADQHPKMVEKLAQQVLAWQAALPAGPMDPDAGSNAYPWPRGS